MWRCLLCYRTFCMDLPNTANLLETNKIKLSTIFGIGGDKMGIGSNTAEITMSAITLLLYFWYPADTQTKSLQDTVCSRKMQLVEYPTGPMSISRHVVIIHLMLLRLISCFIPFFSPGIQSITASIISPNKKRSSSQRHVLSLCLMERSMWN